MRDQQFIGRLIGVSAILGTVGLGWASGDGPGGLSDYLPIPKPPSPPPPPTGLGSSGTTCFRRDEKLVQFELSGIAISIDGATGYGFALRGYGNFLAADRLSSFSIVGLDSPSKWGSGKVASASFEHQLLSNRPTQGQPAGLQVVAGVGAFGGDHQASGYTGSLAVQYRLSNGVAGGRNLGRERALNIDANVGDTWVVAEVIGVDSPSNGNSGWVPTLTILHSLPGAIGNPIYLGASYTARTKLVGQDDARVFVRLPLGNSKAFADLSASTNNRFGFAVGARF